MFRIELIGISGDELADWQRAILQRCYAVVVSKRYHHLVRGIDAQLLPIAPVQTMLARVENALTVGDVAVLAGGDPLFFGIGRTLLERFNPDSISIYPALSAVQLACARFRIPWDDMTFLSLHGRPAGDLPGRILGKNKVMLFTDHRNSPDRVAESLLESLQNLDDREQLKSVKIRVAENLGFDDERLTCGSLEEIAAFRFGPLNMMLIEQDVKPPECGFGLTEDEIRHSRGLITKDEVRAAALHRLRLPRRGVFWDVGGGSGSVSIEAARLCPGLSIYTVEKKEREQNNIRENIKRFGTYNIHLIQGEAPEFLAELPDPDRVFIGGSGGNLEEIFFNAAGRLKPGGRIVVNAVLAVTAEKAPGLLLQQGLHVDIRTIEVSRRCYPDGGKEKFNPITIVTGIK